MPPLFFLPLPVEETTKGEITHFRSEDSHPLCSSSLLVCEVGIKKNAYQMDIFIPAQCLHGYDPIQCKRLGFTYRINRYDGSPQHFAAVSENYHINQHPSLWGSLNLIGYK